MIADTVPITLEFTSEEHSLLTAAAVLRCIDIESLIREATRGEATRLQPHTTLPAHIVSVLAPILFRQPLAL